MSRRFISGRRSQLSTKGYLGMWAHRRTQTPHVWVCIRSRLVPESRRKRNAVADVVTLSHANHPLWRVNLEKLRSESRASKADLGVVSSRLPQLRLQVGIDDSQHGLGQPRSVPRLEAKGGDAIFEELCRAASARHNHGTSAGHGLDDRPAKRLGLGARMHDDIQGSVHASNIVLKGNEAELPLDARRTCLLDELGSANLRTECFVDRTTDHVEAQGKLRPGFSQQACGFDEQAMPLPTRVGRDQTEGRGSRGSGLEASKRRQPVGSAAPPRK